MMRKIASAIFMVLIITIIIIPKATVTVEAKTMNDLYVEMNQLIADKKAAETKKELNDQERIEAIETIKNIEIDIKKTTVEIKDAQEEIEELNLEIKSKNTETKELMRSEQITSGELEYLEYIFKSVDLADFIHRVQTVETLSEHNEEVIAEMEDLIAQNIQLKEDLNLKHINLANQQKQMNIELNSLKTEANQIAEISVDVDEEIEDLEKLIKFYKDQGCENDNDLDVCTKEIPPDNEFWRPTEKGYITSPFGFRTKPYVGYHYGIDIGYNSISWYEEASIYSSANGKVINVAEYSCGGKTVFIVHNVNGIKYTTIYMHMKEVFVNVGDQVTKDDVIGIMGGNYDEPNLPGYTDWDPCSTGRHLHFGLAIGEHRTYTSYKENAVDPASDPFINFPPYNSNSYKRIQFKNRTTEY